MKLPRRQFMRLAAGVVALPSVSRVARADAYPTKPVRLMNGFAAGGTADIFARLMGQWLSERLGQQFLTENRTVQRAILPPKRSFGHLQTATRCCWPLQQMPSMPRSVKS